MWLGSTSHPGSQAIAISDVNTFPTSSVIIAGAAAAGAIVDVVCTVVVELGSTLLDCRFLKLHPTTRAHASNELLIC